MMQQNSILDDSDEWIDKVSTFYKLSPSLSYIEKLEKWPGSHLVTRLYLTGELIYDDFYYRDDIGGEVWKERPNLPQYIDISPNDYIEFVTYFQWFKQNHLRILDFNVDQNREFIRKKHSESILPEKRIELIKQKYQEGNYGMYSESLIELNDIRTKKGLIAGKLGYENEILGQDMPDWIIVKKLTMGMSSEFWSLADVLAHYFEGASAAKIESIISNPPQVDKDLLSPMNETAESNVGRMSDSKKALIIFYLLTHINPNIPAVKQYTLLAELTNNKPINTKQYFDNSFSNLFHTKSGNIRIVEMQFVRDYFQKMGLYDLSQRVEKELNRIKSAKK